MSNSELFYKYWRSTSKPRDKLVIAEFAANKRLSFERSSKFGESAAGYLKKYKRQFPQIDFERPNFQGAKTLANHILEVETTEDAEEFWNDQIQEGIWVSNMRIRYIFSCIKKEIQWNALIRTPTRDVVKANVAAVAVKQGLTKIGHAQQNEMESALIAAAFLELNKLDLMYKNMPIHFALAPTASEQATLVETDSTRSVPGLLIEYVFLPDGVLADGFVTLTLNIPDGDGFDLGDYKEFWLDMKILIDSKIGVKSIQVKSSQADLERKPSLTFL
jgi:hypothetical protein